MTKSTPVSTPVSKPVIITESTWERLGHQPIPMRRETPDGVKEALVGGVWTVVRLTPRK